MFTVKKSTTKEELQHFVTETRPKSHATDEKNGTFTDSYGLLRTAPKKLSKKNSAPPKNSAPQKTLSSYRWMQRESRSCFATSTARECTLVHDRAGTGARHEIDHDAPPQPVFSQKPAPKKKQKKRLSPL